MEGVFDRGLAKAIGVSNFNAEQVQRICDTARVKPHNIQVSDVYVLVCYKLF